MGKRAVIISGSVTVSIAVLAAILGFMYMILDRHHKEWDLTEDQLYTLSGESMKALGALDQDVEITAFFIKNSPYGEDQRRLVMDVLGRYKNASPHIKLVEVDPQLDPITTQQFDVRVDGTLVFRSGGNDKRVLQNDMFTTPHTMGFDPNNMGERKFNGEEAITNAIASVSGGEKKKVCFLKGFGEGSPDEESREGFSDVEKEISGANLDTETLTFFSLESIPDECNAVIWIAPENDVPEASQNVLDDYLNRGGAALVFTDVARGDSLGGFLAKWGGKLGSNIILDRERFYMPLPTHLAPSYGFHEIVNDLRENRKEVIIPTARSLAAEADVPDNMKVIELIRSSEDSWGETDFSGDSAPANDPNADDQGPLAMGIAVVKNLASDSPSDGAKNQDASDAQQPGDAGDTNASGKGGKEARLIAYGDAEFASNQFMLAQNNRDLFLNSVRWLLGDEDRLSIRAKSAESAPLMLTEEQSSLIRLISVILSPLCVILFGGAIWYGRKSR